MEAKETIWSGVTYKLGGLECVRCLAGLDVK